MVFISVFWSGYVGRWAMDMGQAVVDLWLGLGMSGRNFDIMGQPVLLVSDWLDWIDE